MRRGRGHGRRRGPPPLPSISELEEGPTELMSDEEQRRLEARAEAEMREMAAMVSGARARFLSRGLGLSFPPSCSLVCNRSPYLIQRALEQVASGQHESQTSLHQAMQSTSAELQAMQTPADGRQSTAASPAVSPNSRCSIASLSLRLCTHVLAAACVSGLLPVIVLLII